MAKNNSSKSSHSTNVNTRWLNNAMKSIGLSTKDAFRDLYPNISEVTSSAARTSRSVISSLKTGRSNMNRVNDALRTNKYVDYASRAYKNAITDLKSGNFNNQDRLMESMGMDDFESFTDETDFTFGDESEITESQPVNVNYINNGASSDAILAVSEGLQKQSESILKTNKASLDAFVAISSASMYQAEKANSTIISHLSNISNSLETMVQYNNENMTKFIESSMAYYDRVGKKVEEMNTKETIDPMSVMNNAKGGINLSQYKAYVRQQMKSALGNSSIGMLQMIDDDMINMLVSNPLGFATQNLVSYMIPKLVGTTIDSVEKTFSSFVPTMLNRLADLGDEYAVGLIGNAKKLIGKTFGLRVDKKKSIDAPQIQKGAIPYDGETKHAITQIITKELREQTSYLRVIANRFDRTGTKNAPGDADVWDYTTNTFVKVRDTQKNIISEIHDSIVNTFKEGTFGRKLQELVDNEQDEKNRESLQHGIDNLIVALAQTTKHVNPLDRSADSEWMKILKNATANNKKSKKINEIIDDYILEIAATDKASFRDLTRSIISSQQARNDIMKLIEEDPGLYNLYASGLNGKENIDELIDKQYGYGKYDTTSSPKHGYRRARVSAPNTVQGKGFIGRMASASANSINRQMHAIMSGDSRGAVREFGSMMIEQAKIMGNTIKDTLYTPFKKFLFGNRDEAGYSSDGIMSGAQNSLKDFMGHLKWHITGKAWEDSKGNQYREKDKNKSVIGIISGMGDTVKNGILDKLFGPSDENGNRHNEGILNSFTSRFKDGLDSWKSAFLGEDVEGQSKEEIQKKITAKIEDNMPSAVKGGAIGAGVGMLSGGSVLGTIVGGPIAGAAMGVATGIISRSKSFQDWFFGKKDAETGERFGGFVSHATQDYVKKNKLSLIGGAAIGALTSGLTGKGATMMGSIVGGPILGAAMGVASTIVTRSERFKEWFFGKKDENGARQNGLLKRITKSFKGHTNQIRENYGDSFTLDTKALNMGGVGLLGGVLASSFTPIGPIGGALLGLGASIAANAKDFKKLLFGSDYVNERGETKHKHGVFGKFGNMLNANFIRPIKTEFTHHLRNAALDLEYTVGDTIEGMATIVADKAADVYFSIRDRAATMLNKVTDSLKETVLDPVMNAVNNAVITPLRIATQGVTDLVVKGTKAAALFPFKIMKAGLNVVNSKIAELTRPVRKLLKDIRKRIFGGIGTIVSMVGHGVTNALGIVTKPISMLGTVAAYGARKLSNKMGNRTESSEDIDIPDDATRSERWRLRRQMEKRDRAREKQEYKEQKQRDRNARLIAKATHNQFSSDTAEARAAAKRANPRMALKLNTDIKTEDQLAREEKAKFVGSGTFGKNAEQIAKSDYSKLSDEGKQTYLIQGIYNILRGKKIDGSNRSEDESSDSTYNAFSAVKEPGSYDDDDWKTLFDLIKNLGEKEALEKAFASGGSLAKCAADYQTLKLKKDAQAKLEEKLDAIDAAGGLREYAKLSLRNAREKVHNTLNGVKAKFSRSHNEPTEGGNGFGGRGPEDKPVEVIIRDVSNVAVKKLDGEDDKSARQRDIERLRRKDEKEDAAYDERRKSVTQKALELARDRGISAEEKMKQIDEEEKKAQLAAIKENTEEQAKATKSHTSLWASIFGKKGLITGGLLLLSPLLIKAASWLLKNGAGLLGGVVSTVINSGGGLIKSALDAAKRTEVNKDRKNGDSAWERAKKEFGNTVDANAQLADGHPIDALGTFLTDEDGKMNHITNAKAKYLATMPARLSKTKFGKAVKGVGSALKRTGKTLFSAAKGAKNVVTANAAVNATSKIGKKLGGISDNVVTAAYTHGSDAVKASKAKIGATVTKIAEKTNNGIIGKVMSNITEFFSKVIAKVGSRFGSKISTSAFSGVMRTVKAGIKKGASKIVPRVSALLGSTGAVAATGVGLIAVAAKEGTWITLGALNGISGAGRLFWVNSEYVDWKMRAISTIIGGFEGSTVGAVVDIVNEVVAEIMGIDFVSEFACMIYKMVSSTDDAKKLDTGRDAFLNEYYDYKDKAIEDSYNEEIKSGKLSKDVTLEQYKAGVKSGQYKADYDSFADYNDKQHKTIGGKIVDGVVGAVEKVKDVAGSAWNSVKGSAAWVGKKFGQAWDATKNTASKAWSGIKKGASSAWDTTKNLASGAWSGVKKGASWVGDKATQAWDATKNAVSTAWDTTKNAASKATSWVKNGFTSAKNFLFGKKDTAWKSSDGSYYASAGNKFNQYNAQGDLINDKVDNDAVTSMIASGVLVKEEKEKPGVIAKTVSSLVSAGKKTFTSIVEKTSGLWNSVKESSVNVFNKISETGFFGSITKVFRSQQKEAWFDANGNYYKEKGTGKYDYYNAHNDLIRSDIDASEVNDKIKVGLLTKGTIKEDSAAKKAISKIQDAVKGAWDKAKNIVTSGWSKFTNWITGGSGNNDTKTTISDYGAQSVMTGIDRAVVMPNGNTVTYTPESRLSNEVAEDRRTRGAKGGGRGDKLNGFAYYSQDDSRWGNDAYNRGQDNATMADSGCGPTAMSMVASQITGKDIAPTEMATLAKATGDRDETGTNWNFINNAANVYGLNATSQYEPSAEFINSELDQGNPVILSGETGGGNGGGFGRSPYTRAGHYVVAVGKDNAGNVIINDPRGKAYSGKYNLDDVTRETGAAWSFNGGFGKRNSNRKYKGRKHGGRGMNWMTCVKRVKEALAAKKFSYSQSSWVTITIDGVSERVRQDCSGYVSAVLVYYGVFNKGFSTNATSFIENKNYVAKMEAAGFKKHRFESWDKCMEGDILIDLYHHIEIFSHNEGSTHWVYSNGSTKGCQSPTPTREGNSHTYEWIWTPPEHAASVASDGTISSDGSTSSASAGTTDIISTIGGFIGEVGKRAINGALTGNFDTDYSSYWNPQTVSSDTSTGTVSDALTSGGQYPKYNLSPSVKEFASRLIVQETGGSDIVAARQEASQIANLNEVTKHRSNTSDDLYKTMTCGWYANHGHSKRSATSVSNQAVEDVLINGHRTLPRYVTEHDTFPLDIRNAKDRASYRVGDPVSNRYGSNYKFYTFFGKNRKGDISGYFQKDYDKYKGDQPWGGGSGNGVKPYFLPKGGGYGVNYNSATSLNNTSNTTQYRSASKASNYVNQVNSQSSVNQLLNTIIYVLSDIAGNTSNASDKLDLLKNLNGSTTNIITNNGSGVPANTSGLQNIINNANGGPSRNSRLASKIAQGF